MRFAQMTPDEKRTTLEEMVENWEQIKRVSELDPEQLQRFNDRMDTLEAKLSRPIIGSDSAGVIEHKALQAARDASQPADPDRHLFWRAVAAGGASKLRDTAEQTKARNLIDRIERKANIGPEERKALALGDDTLGGFLAPPEFLAEVVKGVQLISPVRGVARIRTTSRKSVSVPVRSGVFAAAWAGETASRVETAGLAYSLEELPVYDMYALVIVSQDDLEDSAFDLNQEIADNAAEQFAKAEGTAFVKGTGVKQPEGFMVNAAVATVPMGTGGGSALTADGIVNFVYQIKTSYAQKATFMLNRKTLGQVRLLKDGQQRYIWSPDYSAANAPTIQGIPYVEAPDMDDVAANAFPIALGDFSRGYMIVDRVNMSIQVLKELYAGTNQIGFLVRKRVGGQVVLPEAIMKLKVSVS